MLTDSQVREALKQWQDPYLGQDWVSANALKKVTIENNLVQLDVVVGYPVDAIKDELIGAASQFLSEQLKAEVCIHLTSHILSHQVQFGLKGIANVKNIIAVASGKGGVGKSTVSANLACALSVLGAKVGLLDADIYGPSQPQIFGTFSPPGSTDQKSLEPVMQYGIALMSIGFLVDMKTAIIWRGPMVSGALQQLLNDTQWPPLDYLVIDLPPGTGDIQLTLAQKIPVSAALIVTTPQDLSLLDARRAIDMFHKVKIPVLGIVENMSLYQCPQCGHTDAIFGEAGGAALAKDCNTELLGQLPLSREVREDTDQGEPTVLAHPSSDSTRIYRQIALKLAAKLSQQARNYASKFPNIVIRND